MQALSIKEMCLHYHINVDSNYIQNYLIVTVNGLRIFTVKFATYSFH
jgi:hypothetical protein